MNPNVISIAELKENEIYVGFPTEIKDLYGGTPIVLDSRFYDVLEITILEHMDKKFSLRLRDKDGIESWKSFREDEIVFVVKKVITNSK